MIHDGYENNRQMKIHSICQFHKRTGMPVEVRVCYETDQGNNCCHCEKCTRTMLGIMAEGEDPRNYGFFCSNEELKENNTFDYRPYVVTPDGVTVYGTTTRTVYTGDVTYRETLDEGPGVHKVDSIN